MQIEYCDRMSKDVDTSDYWLSSEDFRWIKKRRGPFSVDFFASDRSWRMKPFFARFVSRRAPAPFLKNWGHLNSPWKTT